MSSVYSDDDNDDDEQDPDSSSIAVDSEDAYDNVNTENLKTASDKGKRWRPNWKLFTVDDEQDIKDKDDGKKKKTATESISKDDEKANASEYKNSETK